MYMEDHAKAVADRWAKIRAEEIAAGTHPAKFDNYMMRFMLEGGWSEEDAQAICKRAQKLSEKGVNE